MKLISKSIFIFLGIIFTLELFAVETEPPWVTEIRKRAHLRKVTMKGLQFLPPIETRYPETQFSRKIYRFNSAGAKVIWDAFNKEAHLICGANGGEEFGSIGSWTTKDGKNWQKQKDPSNLLPPLRKAILTARLLARNAENSARNIYFSSKKETDKKEALKKTALLLKEAVKQGIAIQEKLNKTTSKTWEKEAVQHALPLFNEGLNKLMSVLKMFSMNKLNATSLGLCFDGQWKWDEAAGSLQSIPVEKSYAFGGYDPANKCIFLFGGSHGDYVTNETWIYDCKQKKWKQIWPKDSPEPRSAWATDSMVRKNLKKPYALQWNQAGKIFVLKGGLTVINKIVPQTGYVRLKDETEWSFDLKTLIWSGNGKTFPSGTRTYRSICPEHNPKWFDSESKGSINQAEKWQKALKQNTWLRVPLPKRLGSKQDWGTALIDPGRDQIYHWSGGHGADVSTSINTYHIGVNRWSIGFIPEVLSKGMTFNGRPDCENHTYLTYAFDPISKKVISVAYGGTCVYDPDKADYDYSIPTPFQAFSYISPMIGTPKGVYLWKNKKMWNFLEKERKWEGIKTIGEIPAPQTDGNGLSYDSKRDCIWLYKTVRYLKPLEDLWKFDIKTNTVTKMSIPNTANYFPARTRVRESVYLPKLDLVLFNNFYEEKQIAYDPNKNAWVLLNLDSTLGRKRKSLGWVSNVLLYDSKRNLVWSPSRDQELWVLKINLDTLKID
ncbi:MAG: hypothetical protein COA79_12485 [Planctomycetota bacterium]|nr:MAG: hypothetical protein COA79_12485 [Planctomycetota bacterium]